MRKAWYRVNPALFEQIKAEVESAYPNLHFCIENGVVFLKGSFPIIYENKILDRYSVEIEFPHDYPDSVQIVREVAGRIPRTVDYHMSTTGEACLFLPDERWQVKPLDATFLDFLNGPVRNFFLGQSLVSLGEPWPFGQWAHGAGGIREYYASLLGTDDFSTIIRYLEYLSKPKAKGHWDCPCGSGKRLRNCHFRQLLDLKGKISPQVARHSLIMLVSSFSTKSSPKINDTLRRNNL
jgi:hypothetical protein